MRSGWEHADESLVMGAIFKKCFSLYDSNDLVFSLAWKHEEGSDCLFCSLFSDLIFLSWWDHWGRSMETGASGKDRED